MGFFLVNNWFLENNCVFESNIFYTTSHMIYFDYKAYACYQNKKTIHVLHKLSFHNPIPHISHSLIDHVFQLWTIILFTSPLWNYFFLVVENHCVFSAHILKLCVFFLGNVREKRKTQTKNYHCAYRSILPLRTVYRHFLASRTAYRLTTKTNHFGSFHLHKEVKITVCCMHIYSNF